MSTATSTIVLPADLIHDISEQASREGVPTEEWVSKALAERIRIQRATEDFFRHRAARASGLPLGAILDKGGYPDRAPDPGDEL